MVLCRKSPLKRLTIVVSLESGTGLVCAMAGQMWLVDLWLMRVWDCKKPGIPKEAIQLGATESEEPPASQKSR